MLTNMSVLVRQRQPSIGPLSRQTRVRRYQKNIHPLTPYPCVLKFFFIISAEAREYVFSSVGLSVCLSVTMITKTIVDGFVPNFIGRFLGGKGRPSSCFVTIVKGIWK